MPTNPRVDRTQRPHRLTRRSLRPIVAFVGFVGGWTPQVFSADSLPNAGRAAAVVATCFTFLPPFIFILAGGPRAEATHDLPRLDAPLAVSGVAGVALRLTGLR